MRDRVRHFGPSYANTPSLAGLRLTPSLRVHRRVADAKALRALCLGVAGLAEQRAAAVAARRRVEPLVALGALEALLVVRAARRKHLFGRVDRLAADRAFWRAAELWGRRRLARWRWSIRGRGRGLWGWGWGWDWGGRGLWSWSWRRSGRRWARDRCRLHIGHHSLIGRQRGLVRCTLGVHHSAAACRTYRRAHRCCRSMSTSPATWSRRCT